MTTGTPMSMSGITKVHLARIRMMANAALKARPCERPWKIKALHRACREFADFGNAHLFDEAEILTDHATGALAPQLLAGITETA